MFYSYTESIERDVPLKENKNFPNSPLPVLIYKKAINLPDQKNHAADIIQQTLLHNGWKNSWRNGIYNFHHFHSNTHECLVVASGKAKVFLGGPSGRSINLKAGDAVILPAGTAHKCIESSNDFLCVGAYPQDKDYDIKRGEASELKETKENIDTIENVKDRLVNFYSLPNIFY